MTKLTQSVARRGWFAAGLVLCLALVSSEVRSQSKSQSGEQSTGGGEGASCEYHTDCDSGYLCMAGSCQTTAAVRQALLNVDGDSYGLTASEACGGNRQCRIDHLKQHNRRQRRQERARTAEAAREKASEIQKRQLKEFARLDNAISVDWRASRLGALGIAAGYTFGGRLRAELQLAHRRFFFNQTIESQESDYDVNGRQRVTFLMPGVYYFFLESDFTPYLGATFLYGRGQLNASTNSFGDNQAPEQPDLGTEYHSIGLHGGLDFQWQGNGFHSRLGLAYRPPIYQQARISAGQYSESGREAIEQWYNEMVRIDVVFLLGWSF